VHSIHFLVHLFSPATELPDTQKIHSPLFCAFKVVSYCVSFQLLCSARLRVSEDGNWLNFDFPVLLLSGLPHSLFVVTGSCANDGEITELKVNNGDEIPVDNRVQVKDRWDHPATVPVDSARIVVEER
jgi:hypothetical protein